jgi:tRNA-splicing ligase RtcB
MSKQRRFREQAPSVPIEKVDEYRWRIPKSYKQGMRVPGIVFADDQLIEKMKEDRTLNQCANVAHLPGIYNYAITLPDGHEGYGFPIGGVAATDHEEGVISPGGVGYDINCGVRLLTTNLSESDIKLNMHELEHLITEGVSWAVKKELGRPEDIEHCEERGCMEGANPDKVSYKAKQRGLPQSGTLGSGNHFLEIGKVDRIYDKKVAKTFGVTREGQVTVLIHCGSRGLGHQTCSDYLRVMERAVQKYNISIPDRELACAPATSNEAQDYYQAMACAVNYAFVNRQVITHWVRQSFEEVLKGSADDFGLDLVYDVAHNIAKSEEHMIEGKRTKVWTHRKGATRCFPPEHREVPADYRSVGQPVIIPGSMGTSSWLLVGKHKAMELSFGSTAHGAGRMMSRSAAKRRFWGGDIKQELEGRGIVVRAASSLVLAEEADPAYKNVDNVVEVSDKAGIATKVVRLVPLGVVKG